MPIYEYQCEKCHHCFEVLVFRSDEADVTCSKCGNSEIKRLLSSTCIIGGSGSNECSSGASTGFS